MTAKDIMEQARQFNPCNRFNGCSNIIELIDLMQTPQGIEFCTRYNYPSIKAFEDLDKDFLSEKGIYIDAEDIELTNKDKVFLFGKTSATLIYDDPTKRHQVVLMRGTKAKITATGYSVIAVANAGGTLETELQDNAIIL